jgi:hypothetical protein
MTAPAWAQGTGRTTVAVTEEVPAQECCLSLLRPVGARAVALGRALTATASADAVFANPAGLAGLRRNQFTIHHAPLLEEQQANAFSLLLTPRDIGTVGLAYELTDYGSVEAVDADGRTTGFLTLREHLLVASFGTRVGGGLSAGLSYKLYQFRVGCRGRCPEGTHASTTHGIDVGLRHEPAWLPALQLGAAVTDVGFALQVRNARQADPLPTRLRLGASYEVLRHFVVDTSFAVHVHVEHEQPLRSAAASVPSIGVELAAAGAVFLRAGYRLGEGIEAGPAVGVGLEYDRFSVAIGRTFVASALDPEHEPVHVTFGIRF